jgi:hypothetical protein
LCGGRGGRRAEGRVGRGLGDAGGEGGRDGEDALQRQALGGLVDVVHEYTMQALELRGEQTRRVRTPTTGRPGVR